MTNKLVKKEDILKYEKGIIWLEEPNNFPWVRESSTDFFTKKGISKNRHSEIERLGEKIIGYAELEDNAPPSFIDDLTNKKHYYRRIFTLRDGDYEAYKNNYPTEAVDPVFIEAKFPGLSPRKKAQIAVRIPLPLLRKLNSHIRKTGISQTDLVVSALASYLDAAEEMPLIQRIVEIEKRLAALEGAKRSRGVTS
ncbi:MAG: DUF6009 family protein [Xenococcaceae cyanobacterium]